MRLSKEKLYQLIFKEYVEGHSEDLGLKEKTIKGKRNTLKRFWFWLDDKPFCAESCRYWIRYLRKKGYQPESLKHEIRILRATIKFLHDRGYIEKNFASTIPYPKVPKKPLKIVPAEIAEQVILAGTKPDLKDNKRVLRCKREHRAALRFVLRTGLRSRELQDLKGSDFNLKEKTFLVNSKSGNIDILPIPEDMISELEKRADKEKVFDVYREYLNRSLKSGCKKVGVKIKITTHTLRHIFCTSLIKRGVSTPVVSRLMRHTSVVITDRVYTHYNVEDLRLELNSKHPMIMQGLGPEDVFKQLQEAIEATRVKTDSRFSTSIDTSSEELVMRFKLI